MSTTEFRDRGFQNDSREIRDRFRPGMSIRFVHDGNPGYNKQHGFVLGEVYTISSIDYTGDGEYRPLWANVADYEGFFNFSEIVLVGALDSIEGKTDDVVRTCKTLMAQVQDLVAAINKERTR